MLAAAVEGVLNLAKRRHYAAAGQAQPQQPAQPAQQTTALSVPPGYMVVDDGAPQAQATLQGNGNAPVDEEYERKKAAFVKVGITLLVFGGAAYGVYKLWPMIRPSKEE